MTATASGNDLIQAWSTYYDQIITTLAIASAYGSHARLMASESPAAAVVDSSMKPAIDMMIIALSATTDKSESTIRRDIVVRLPLIFGRVDTSA